VTTLEAQTLFQAYKPTIVLTACNEREKLMKVFGLDIVDYLLKSINRKKLSPAVNLALETLLNCDNKHFICQIDSNMRWDEQARELYQYAESVGISQLEKWLLSLLCGYKNQEVSSHDIYFHV